MSRSWAERWRIGLAPDGAELLRLGAFGFGRPGTPRRQHCQPQPGQPPWEPALAALAQLLEEAGAAGAAAGVVLSNHFLRYLVLPWQPELNSARELEQLARLRMRAVYGEAADGWTLACSEGGWGRTSVACAVDSGLIAALRTLLAARRLRLASLQPLLMAAFNDHRRRLAGDGAFAVVEPGRLCLGLLQEGGFAAIASRRTGADAAAVAGQELAALGADATTHELSLLRVNGAVPWPHDPAVAARELVDAPRPLAACGVA